MTGGIAPAEYRQFAQQLTDLREMVKSLTVRDILENASVGSGGIDVNGGTIHVYNGGSIVVDGSGSITLPSGTLSAGNLSISGTGSIGGLTIPSGGLTVSAGGASIAGGLGADSLSVTGGGSFGSNLSTSGTFTASGVIKSPGSYAYVVSTGYVACWINNDGTFGYSPSTRASKKNLVAMTGRSALSQSVTPYWGHYKTDADDDPLRVFLVAEEVRDAGYGPDLVPVDEDGNLFTLNYAQVVVPLLRDIINIYDILARHGLT